MSEQNPKNRIDPTAAGAADRELIDTALQHNPVIAIATALLVPVLSLFRRRGRPTAAAVEKMKLESYSYRPVGAAGPGRPESRGEGDERALKGHPKGRPMEPTGPAAQPPARPSGFVPAGQKGGCRHG